MNFLAGLLIVFLMTGVTVLLIAAVKRSIGRRMPPSFHYFIWMLLVLRLLFPILPSSSLSISNLLTEPMALTTESSLPSVLYAAVSVREEAAAGEIRAESPASSAAQPRPSERYRVEAIGSRRAAWYRRVPWDTVFFAVWLSVAAAGIVSLAVGYRVSRRRLWDASEPCTSESVLRIVRNQAQALHLRRDIPIRVGDKSLTYGFLHPFVILDGRMLDNAEMISAHELIHIRRRDCGINVLLEILTRLYWFQPLVGWGIGRMIDDRELLCDREAIEKFHFRKDAYAMMLYRSVRSGRSEGISAAATMSAAGRQVIRRVEAVRQNAKPRLATVIVCLLLVMGICTSCLTDPQLSAAVPRHTAEFMENYAALAGGAVEALPGEKDTVTVRGYLDMLFTALDSDAVPLPDAVQARFDYLKARGAAYFTQEILKNKYTASFSPDDEITRECAAYLTEQLLLCLERDLPASSGLTVDASGSLTVDSEGSWPYGDDPSRQVPAMMDAWVYREMLDAVAAKAESGAIPETAAQKLNAFYTSKSYEGVGEGINPETQQPYTPEEKARLLCDMQATWPIVDIGEYCIFDPYASPREIALLASYIREWRDCSDMQTDIFNQISRGSHPGRAFPYLLPSLIGEESFRENLLGTITGDPLTGVSGDELKAEIQAAYSYDDQAKAYRLTVQDEAAKETLSNRLARASGYTYAQMASDHALMRYSLLKNGYADAVNVCLWPVRPYTAYTDEAGINDTALNSVRELASCGILPDGGAFRPADALVYADAAEWTVRFVCGLASY